MQLIPRPDRRPGSAALKWLLGLLPWTAEALGRAASRARRNHDLDRALDRARAAEARSPDHAEGPYWLGRALLDQGRPTDAALALSRACLRVPGDATPLGALGAALHEAGDAAEALDILDAALVLEPGHTRLWHNRGLALMALRRWDAAATSFGEAGTRAPHSATLRSLRGYCLAMAGRPQEAVQAYVDVKKLDRHYPRASYNLGACLYAARRYAEARKAFERALAEDPSDDRAARALQRLSTM